jgi:ribonucleoside-diphosphate reductase beta chain
MLAGYDHLLRSAQRLRWDERPLPLASDAPAFAALDGALGGRLRRLVAGFCVAEAAVAVQLGPFVDAAEDPVQRACFAAQADDERRHARFFGRVAREVAGLDPEADARAVAGAPLVELFEARLPATAARLAAGDCGLSEAVALYHLVLEGIVFSAGQEVLLEALDEAGTLPVLREGVQRVQGDERWHVGLGVTCLAHAGLPPDAIERLLVEAEAAARCWGEDIVSPERAARALELHRRRLVVAGLVPSAVAA